MESSSSLPQGILHFIAWFIFFSLLTANVSYKKVYYLFVCIFAYFSIFQLLSITRGGKLHERQGHYASVFSPKHPEQ